MTAPRGTNRLRGLGALRIFRTNKPTSVTDAYRVKRPSTEMPGTMQRKLGKK